MEIFTSAYFKQIFDHFNVATKLFSNKDTNGLGKEI
jgi:hypothetical protein